MHAHARAKKERDLLGGVEIAVVEHGDVDDARLGVRPDWHGQEARAQPARQPRDDRERRRDGGERRVVPGARESGFELGLVDRAGREERLDERHLLRGLEKEAASERARRDRLHEEEALGELEGHPGLRMLERITNATLAEGR